MSNVLLKPHLLVGRNFTTFVLIKTNYEKDSPMVLYRAGKKFAIGSCDDVTLRQGTAAYIINGHVDHVVREGRPVSHYMQRFR